jgi:TolB-like protein/DNA-binding winged helix-turn-helix (wHTH) protein/Tfp pilus assembly protein PilF
MKANLQKAFRLGDWGVYPHENCLRGASGERLLEPKVMDVLVLLAGRPGEVVSREQLLDSVWSGTVVGDEVLSRAISILRAALGDEQKNPAYLKTVHKRGYCLIAEVQLLEHEETDEPGDSQDRPQFKGSKGLARKSGFLAIALLVLALGHYVYDGLSTQPASTDVFENAGISIAVLPFVNMSDGSENAYFADGLSEEILNLLVGVPEFRVVARTSSFAYKGKSAEVAQIGKELGVSHVLEGSVRKSEKRIRITARLVRADNGLHLWSETFDRVPDDIFVLQDEIATSVVNALNVKLLHGMQASYATDSEVHALYLQGLYFLNIEGGEGYRKSADSFRKVLAMDPEYAPAWTAIARTYTHQVRAGLLTREQGRELAMGAIETALALDEDMASAWANLAYQKRFYDLDWEGAMAALERALELEPNNAQVLGVAASFAGSLGRVTESTELHERALALDPLNLTALSAMGQDYLRNGRADDAIRIFTRLVTLSPNHYTGHTNLGRAYFLKGNVEQALTEIGKSRSKLLRTFEEVQIHLALGEREKAQPLVKEYLENYSHVDVVRTAALFAALGDNDSAFEWLTRAFEERDVRLSWFLTDVHLRKLQDDPRYPVFLEKIGLLAAWKAMSN